jgi:hypothetical protein
MDRKIAGPFFSEHHPQDDILPLRSQGFSPGIMDNKVFGEYTYSSDQSAAMIRHCNFVWEMQPSLLGFFGKRLKNPDQSMQKISLTILVLTLIDSLTIDQVLLNRLATGEGMFQHVTSEFLQNGASTY